MSEPSGVSIREVHDDDLGSFFEFQADPEAVRMAASSPRKRDSFLAHWAKIRADDTIVTQTIVVDGEVAGNLVSWEQDGQRLLGYWIARPYWGRGVATGALALFLARVLARPLHAEVATHNVGSIRVLEKCGFRQVGAPSTNAADGIEEASFVLA